MRINNLKGLTALLVVAAITPLATHAIPVTLGGLPVLREATLDSATAGFTGSGNAGVAVVNAGFPSMALWTERGSNAGTDGTSGILTDGMLTVNVTSGTWGSNNVAGTWTINNGSFWTDYANGAISLHLGGGRPSNAGPDHFVWLLEVGASSGTWSYDGRTTPEQNGGGLSNLKLYSSGTGTSVPDGGATLALFGLALLGLSAIRRIKRA